MTASGTLAGWRARPETLRAIRQAAEVYGIPAQLTGVAKQGVSFGSFDRLLVRRAGLVFSVLLTAGATALAGTWILFSWGSRHHNNYNPSTTAFCAAVIVLCCTFLAWERRKNLSKSGRMGQTAAGLAETGDSAASPCDRAKGPAS